MTFVNKITTIVILKDNIEKNSRRLEELTLKDRSNLPDEENRKEEQKIRGLKAKIDRDNELLCRINGEL